jgi:nucleotide-binding universal stress UspA family protein
MQRLFSELPGRVLLGNCVSGIHLCYSAWQVGLPKEAGSKEDKMSIFPTRILLATDGLEEATLAAETAIDLANKTGSELHVVHVRISLYSPAFSEAYEGYEEGVDVGAYLQDESEELTRRGQSLLDEQVRKIKAAGGNVAQAHLRVGRPEAEITALAEEIGAGLIVVGSRDLGGIRRSLLGSVSDSVVRHAHCPVFVVRKEEPTD